MNIKMTAMLISCLTSAITLQGMSPSNPHNQLKPTGPIEIPSRRPESTDFYLIDSPCGCGSRSASPYPEMPPVGTPTASSPQSSTDGWHPGQRR